MLASCDARLSPRALKRAALTGSAADRFQLRWSWPARTTRVETALGNASQQWLLASGPRGWMQQSNRGSSMDDITRHSVITCPHCGFARREEMPIDACQFFYDCSRCGARLRPKKDDCCVF